MRSAIVILLVCICASALAEPGLVGLVAREAKPSPAAALGFIAGKAGRLDVRWRPLGTKPWAGGIATWKTSHDVATGQATGDGLFTASLATSAFHDGLRLELTLTATRPAAQPTEVVLTCPFDPSSWTRQFYPCLPYLVTAPAEPVLLRFAADADDATTSAQAPRVVFYPFGVLESKKAFVLWGCPDVGRYAVLSPNALAPGAPSLSLRPKHLAAGQKLVFDLILRRFSKPEFLYRDVLRWYLRSATSSDPLVADLFPWDGKSRARRLPVGNLSGGTGCLGQPADARPKFLALLRARHVTDLWFQGWGPWDETYPTSGSWLTEGWRHISAAQVRDEIAWERAHGLCPLLYCRQFLTEQGVHSDRPPLRDWLGRDETGKRQAWGDAHVPNNVAKVVGFHTLQQSIADFENDGFRAWYEGRVKACMDYYQPGGIAWDMGWAAPPSWEYSRAHPKYPNSDGMLRVQADLFAWLKAHHPGMRVISNEAPGTPSQMFADGILIEGGFAAGKGPLDYEAAKALGTTVISYEYPDRYGSRLKGLPTTRARYLQMRYRAEGVDTASGRYVVWPTQMIPGKEGAAFMCKDLVADGKWHVATFDMSKLPAIAQVKGMALGLQAGADVAHLWIDYLRFSETPKGPPLQAGPDSFPSAIGAADAGSIEARPGWLGNPATEYGVRRDNGAIELTVHGAGRGMSWEFLAASGEIAQEYLRVVSLGACLGAGVREEWPTLDAFSAQAMAIPPLVGSHDIEVSPESAGVTASAWGGDGHLLIAAHNGSAEAQSVTIDLAAPALKRSGARLGKGALSRILGRDALPSRTGPAATAGRNGGLTLAVRLGPGEALLWGSWAWE